MAQGENTNEESTKVSASREIVLRKSDLTTILSAHIKVEQLDLTQFRLGTIAAYLIGYCHDPRNNSIEINGRHAIIKHASFADTVSKDAMTLRVLYDKRNKELFEDDPLRLIYARGLEIFKDKPKAREYLRQNPLNDQEGIFLANSFNPENPRYEIPYANFEITLRNIVQTYDQNDPLLRWIKSKQKSRPQEPQIASKTKKRLPAPQPRIYHLEI